MVVTDWLMPQLQNACDVPSILLLLRMLLYLTSPPQELLKTNIITSNLIKEAIEALVVPECTQLVL